MKFIAEFAFNRQSTIFVQSLSFMDVRTVTRITKIFLISALMPILKTTHPFSVDCCCFILLPYKQQQH